MFTSIFVFIHDKKQKAKLSMGDGMGWDGMDYINIFTNVIV